MTQGESFPILPQDLATWTTCVIFVKSYDTYGKAHFTYPFSIFFLKKTSS